MIRKERELTVSLGDLPTPHWENAGFSATNGSLVSGGPMIEESWCWLNPGGLWEHPHTDERQLCSTTPHQDSYLRGRANAKALSTAPSDLGYEKLVSSSRAKPLFNSCEHEISRGFNYPFLSSVTYGPTSSNFRYRRFAKPRGITLKGVPLVNRLPWGAFESAQREAWWSMQPRFETEVQLLNFIYELKDFKTLSKMLFNFKLADIGAKMRRLKRRLHTLSKQNKTVAQLGYATLADITKVSAAARLVNEFAIKPLISDLTSIFTTLAATIDLAQSQFSSRGKLSQLSHFSVTDYDQTGTYGTRYNAPRYAGVRSETVFTATMQYKYHYKMRRGWEKWKAGMGLEPTPEVLWNMIPFSFLADYIYQIGAALRNMELDPNVSMRLLQYCESILQMNSVGVYMDRSIPALRTFYAPANPMGKRSMVPCTGYARSLYRRRLVAPNKGATLPRAKNPSHGQLLNLSALIRCFMD